MWPYLADCAGTDPSVSEIFIVQDRLAPPAKRIRDRVTQAILPIDATIPSIESSDLGDLLGNYQIQGIIAALGVGIILFEDSVGKVFDISRLRYGKIIVGVERGEQGRRIRDEVLAFFRRFNEPLIAGGFVYAVPGLPGELSDDEFEAKVMRPAARRLIQIPAGLSIAELIASVNEADPWS